MVQIMDQMISKPKFMKCFITHISVAKKEIEIWCQTDANIGSRVETLIDSCHSHLSDLFAINSQQFRPIPDPQVGDYYLTHMKNDLHFYRIVVTHVDHQSGQALVHFIDFGNEDWVPFTHLVVLDKAFESEALAQKCFLADIKPKDKEWDSDEVKRLLQPYLLSTFLCEVIRMTKNTKYIRVYDHFFNQPLIQTLVRQCDGILSYNSSEEIFKAIDLTINTRVRVQAVNENGFQRNSVNETQIESQINGTKSDDKDIESEKQYFNTTKDIQNVAKDVDKYMKSENKNIEIKKKEVESDIKDSERMAKNSETNKIESKDTESETKLVECETKIVVKEVKSDNKDIENESKAMKSETKIIKIETKVTESEAKDFTNETKDTETMTKVIISESKVIENEDKSTDNETKDIKNEIKDTESEDKDIDCETKDIKTEAKDTETKTKLIISENKIIENEDKSTERETKDIESDSKVLDESLKSEDNSKEESKTEEVVINSDSVVIGGDSHELMKKESIYMTASHSDNTFHIQLVSKFDEITDLNQNLNEFYSKTNSTEVKKLSLDFVKINQTIAAKFSEDKLWYRASVKDKKSETHFHVIYMDFGNEEEVDISDCKALTPEFEAIPPQAILCSFDGPVIPMAKLEEYILNMNEIICEFVEIKDKNVYKTKIIEIK